MRLRSQSGLKLVEVLVLIVTLAVLSSLVLHLTERAARRSAMRACASNLKSLWATQFNYAAQYGRPNGDLPAETGVDFWLKLQRTPRPLIDRFEPFFCPLADDEIGPGKCSYRGPAYPLSRMPAEDPFAGDKEGNHGEGAGGNLILKTGDVVEVEADDPRWIRARITTTE